MSIYRGIGGAGSGCGATANEFSIAIQEAIDAAEDALIRAESLKDIYVKREGDTLTGELKGIDAITDEGFMPRLQVLNAIDSRIASSAFYDPSLYQDFELITTTHSESRDYGLITQPVTDTIDYGAL